MVVQTHNTDNVHLSKQDRDRLDFLIGEIGELADSLEILEHALVHSDEFVNIGIARTSLSLHRHQIKQATGDAENILLQALFSKEGP